MRDMRLTPDGDLHIANGDVVIGDATFDNQQLLLAAEKSSLRHAPLRGVGVLSYLDDEGPRSLVREVRRQFALDGMKVRTVTYLEGNMRIDASYV